jgi:hypothetical protein
MSCAVHRTSDMLTTSLTGADASMSAFTTPRIYTCLTDATHADVAKAMNYMLKRWDAFTRFLDDGRICLTNNAAERALRRVVMAGSLCTPSLSA